MAEISPHSVQMSFSFHITVSFSIYALTIYADTGIGNRSSMTPSLLTGREAEPGGEAMRSLF